MEEAFSGTIWQAGRATSAAPTLFDRLNYSDKSYTDGGTIANNPTKEAIYEATSLWPERDIALIFGIGTGPSTDLTLANAPREYLPSWVIHYLKFLLEKHMATDPSSLV